MKTKSSSSCLSVAVRALIGSVSGVILGGLIYGTLLPLWTVTSIGQAPEHTVAILFVDYRYPEAVHVEDNTLYLQTQSGNVYAGLQTQWQLLLPLPNGNTISQIWLRDWETEAPIIAVTAQSEAYQMTDSQWKLIENPPNQFKGFRPTPCATRWYLPAIGVVDSAGTVFRHALADEYVCYVLFKDSRLQVWARTVDAFSLMEVSVVSALVGMVLALNAVAILNYFRSLRGIGKAFVS